MWCILRALRGASIRRASELMCWCCDTVLRLQVHPDFSSINTTHHIHRLQFGPGYYGRVSPLDGHDRIVGHDYGALAPLCCADPK